MKNILVPTDFSACAKNATYAAMELAASYRATMHLYTVVEAPTDWESLSAEAQAKYPEVIQNIHNAEVLLEDWKQIAIQKNAPIKTICATGNLVKNIEQYVTDHPIDFVVMGSHGASGKNEYFIGSNTQKVVRSIHIPVLIIKEKLNSYRINKVVFASNFNTSDKAAFQYLLDFVKPFKPEIHLLQVNTTGWFSEPYILVKEAMDDYKEMCGDLNCITHFNRDWSIDAGIRNLSQEIGTDLVAISNLNRHPLKRFFSGSNVEMLVNHSKVPVMSIDFRDGDE